MEDSFGRKWEGGSDPRRHHGIVSLDRCHYNFLVPLFSIPILQDSAEHLASRSI